jgi:hypothetical protein
LFFSLVKGGLKMRRIIPSMLPSMLLCGGLTLLAGLGCGGSTTTTKPADGEALVLEYEEIDIFPGDDKEVKVKSGKAEKAEAPEDKGVKAKVEGDKLKVSADKDAKEGTHTVTVKGGKKDATLKVKVKKKE